MFASLIQRNFRSGQFPKSSKEMDESRRELEARDPIQGIERVIPKAHRCRIITKRGETFMGHLSTRLLGTAALFTSLAILPAQAAGADDARLKTIAGKIQITRDSYGIAHVKGKTDADAVFGMVYAQAEDDFNRVETNYINAMGRLAEAEGEARVYQDLRMKLFIDPTVLKQQYAASPAWLRSVREASVEP